MTLFDDWFNKYRCEVRQSGNVVYLSGVISPDSWFDDDNISARKVREAIDELDGDITIRLNSPGGSAFEGIEIYNYLKSIENKVTVEVTGLVASAGTFICMGADKVLMNTGSQMMIHNAWTLASGNAYELLQVVEDLETIDSSIKDIYSERTGMTREEITKHMENAKLWTAKEAVDYGFADECLSSRKLNLNQGAIIDSSNITAINLDTNNLTISAHNITAGALFEKEEKDNQNKIQKLFGGK